MRLRYHRSILRHVERKEILETLEDVFRKTMTRQDKTRQDKTDRQTDR